MLKKWWCTFVLGILSFGISFVVIYKSTLFEPQTQKVIKILLIAGGFGGLLLGLIERERKLELCDCSDEKRIELGSLSDIFIGIGASLAVFFVLSSFLNIKYNEVGKDTDSTLRLIGLGIVSGLAGKSLLSNLQKKLLKQIQDLEKEVLKTKKDSTRGDNIGLLKCIGESNRLNKIWEDSKWAFNQAINLDKNDAGALLGLAKTLLDESRDTDTDETKKQELLVSALDNCNKVIISDKNFAPAYLVRATVRQAMAQAQGEIEKDLRESISLDQQMKKFINKEQLFDNIKKEPWFKSIIQ